MPWHTKMRWLSLRNEPKLREMQEVYVLRSNIWSQRQNNRGPCDRKSRRVRNRATPGMFGSCSEKYLLYNRTCLTEERFNHFKVIQYGPGRYVHVKLKTILINEICNSHSTGKANKQCSDWFKSLFNNIY